MRQRLQQWRRLPANEKRHLLAYALLLPVIHACLRLFGLRRTQSTLHRLTPQTRIRVADRDTLAWAQRSAQLAAIAGRHGVVAASCLRQALAVETVLRHARLRPSLRLGVDRRGSGPDMHAWVELEGEPLGQPDLRHRPFSGLATKPGQP